MTEWLHRFSDFLTILVPIFGFVYLLVRIYIESKDKEVLQELRAFRAEFRQQQTDIHNLKLGLNKLKNDHERKNQTTN